MPRSSSEELDLVATATAADVAVSLLSGKRRAAQPSQMEEE